MARKLCCDLIMVLYICPAICDPESYGIISDIQITSVARHNLMQVCSCRFFNSFQSYFSCDNLKAMMVPRQSYF